MEQKRILVLYAGTVFLLSGLYRILQRGKDNSGNRKGDQGTIKKADRGSQRRHPDFRRTFGRMDPDGEPAKDGAAEAER